MRSQQLLTLHDALLIGSGNDRNCYQHPDNPGLCIKIENKYSPQTHDKPPKQNNNEFRYYKRFTNGKGHPVVIPACHGWLETNKGRGLVFDLIRDSNGKVSTPFDKLIESGSIAAEQARTLLRELKHEMLHHSIIPSDLALRNMVLQQAEGRSRLILIDGIGSRDFIKLAERVAWIGRKKIDRRWRKFVERQAKQHPEIFSAFDA